MIARKTHGDRTTENMTFRKVKGEKITLEKEGRTMGRESRDIYVSGGKMKGRKEVREEVPKWKSITGMMTGRKETGNTGITEKPASIIKRPGRYKMESLL